MNWIDDLNRAMGYIEENLTGEIDLAKVARQAACSQFHLQRMFPYMTGPMPDAMQRLQHRILAEWLPSSGYEWASKSDVEVYFGPNMTAEDYRSQVWLPIEKRQA